MFPLLAIGQAARQGGRGEGDALHREGQPRQVRRQPSAHAVGRHEAARGDRARHGDGARHAADGRAVRRARRPDPAQDAGRAAAALGRHALHRAVRHPFDPRGDQVRQPHPAAVAAPGPGQGRARQRAARCRRPAPPPRRSKPRSTTCCSPTRSKPTPRPPMADKDAVLVRRPEFHREPVDSSAFGVVQKPLSRFEQLYNNGAAAQDGDPGRAGARSGRSTRAS